MPTAVGSRGRLAVLGVVVAVAAGAGFLLVEPHLTSASRNAACGVPFAERIDPRSSQHLLPDAPEPPYITNPPTSGAHKPGLHPTGVLRQPIERPVQVSMLESGEVLAQYNGLSAAEVGRLQAVAGDHLSVAPNPTIDEPIVVTAWLWKMTCSRVDMKALRDFVSAHRLEAPTH